MGALHPVMDVDGARFRPVGERFKQIGELRVPVLGHEPFGALAIALGARFADNSKRRPADGRTGSAGRRGPCGPKPA